MPDRQIKLARLLITLPAVFIALGPPIADLNATHIGNPLWSPHARLHTVWLICTNSLIAVFALGLLWHHVQELTRGAVDLAAALVGAVLVGFFVAAATRSIYGGALADINGIELRVAGLDANLAGFGVCALLVIAAVVLSRTAPR